MRAGELKDSGMSFNHRNSQARLLVAAMFALGLLLPALALAQTQPAAPSPAAPAAVESAPSVTPAPQSAEPAQPAVAPAPDAILRLPKDLSPWGMFMAADIVVKAVMIGLAFASVLTWTIWFAKAIELLAARRRLGAAIAALGSARAWSDVRDLQGGKDAASALIGAADTELQQSADALSPEGVKERIASRLERLEAAAGRQMIRGTGILATIGATAPFVGLFGTVWGIMNAFIGISKSHTTNLAVVAPGIAEALLATALGLIAAIPAVVMYNMFSRWIAGYRALHADTSAEILRLISRDLDRGTFNRRRVAAAE
jgi:biopolymer transport protein ExbB